jgi:Tfp pilus assembly protein PilN
VAVSGTADAPEVPWTLDVATPGGIFGNDGQFDSVAAGRALTQLVGDAPDGVRGGALVLPSAVMRVRRLVSAPGDPLALRRALVEDSELRVPGVPVEQLHHAVSAFGDTPDAIGGNAAPNAVAAAARRDALRAYTAAGAPAGLGSLRISALAVTLANVHAAIHPEEGGRPVLLLHVGAHRSDIVVVHGGRLLLALPIVLGYQQLIAGGVAQPVESDAPRPHSDEARLALDEWVSRFRGSHRIAVGAAERHLRSNVEELSVRLSGGFARYSELAEALAAGLGVPVGALDPASQIGGAAREWFGPAMVPALGAALEAQAASSRPSGSSTPVLLDLALPVVGSARAARRAAVGAVSRDPAVWMAVLVALALLMGVPAIFEARLRTLSTELDADRQAYRREAEQVAADSARISALRADSLRLAGTLGTLATLEADRYRWPKLMHAAAAALPRYAWLEAVELESAPRGQPSRFRIRGVAPTQAEISAFERAVEIGVGSSSTDLEASEALKVGPFPLVGFRLTGVLGSDGVGGDQPHRQGTGYNGGMAPPAPSQTAP